MANSAPITLSSAEASYNMTLYKEHEEGCEKNKELYFGVYRGRTFVSITQETPLLQRVKYYVQWLFGLISYEPRAIAKLAEISKKQNLDGTAKELLQNEIKNKNKQLELVKNLLAQAQHSLQAKETQRLAAEQESELLRNTSLHWNEAYKGAQQALDAYQTLHKDIQTREDEKNAKVLKLQEEVTKLTQQLGTKQTEVDELQVEVQNLRRQVRCGTSSVSSGLEMRPLTSYQLKPSPGSPIKIKKHKKQSSQTVNPLNPSD